MGELARYGGSGDTTLTVAAGFALAISALMILFLPRKYIAVPFLFAALLIPMGNYVYFLGMHLIVFRLVIFFGCLRLLGSKLSASEASASFRINRIDRTVILWGIFSVITFTILYGEWQAFVNRIGYVYNIFGTYFFLRFFMRDEDDVDRVSRVLVAVCSIAAIGMLAEHFSGRNVFSILGGVPTISAVREGSIRAQGPFDHPILAGTFGAVLLPLFVGLWRQNRKRRGIAVLGMFSSTIIMLASASSTPVLAYLAGILALCFWPLRDKMRLLRWGLVISLICLQMVMKAPVWALIGRVDVVGGSSGYHRYELVNQFIRHFWEWWLVGTATNGQWGYYMHDTSNQYVDIGVTGGLISLALFITIIIYCLKALGTARKREEANGNLAGANRAWALGSVLFANMVAFIGISYFDQTALLLYALFVMIVTASYSSHQLLVPEAETESEIQFGVKPFSPAREPVAIRSRNSSIDFMPPRL